MLGIVSILPMEAMFQQKAWWEEMGIQGSKASLVRRGVAAMAETGGASMPVTMGSCLAPGEAAARAARVLIPEEQGDEAVVVQEGELFSTPPF